MPNCENRTVKAGDVVWLDDTGSDRPSPQMDRALSLRNVSEMFVVSQLTLRYYELRGLIRRGYVQDGVPVYGWADCERIAFIIKCRKAGLTLRDISAILDATDDDVAPENFKAGQEVCMTLVERLERRRKVIDDALAELSHVYALLTAKLMADPRSEENKAEENKPEKN
jgi:DNA-binding transcriptional MerR regulator